VNIKIDIDITPEEARRFLGLPDVSGLQEDMMRYVREKVGQGAEGFDPAAFLRETALGGTNAWQRLMTAALSRAQEAAEAYSATASEPKRDNQAGSTGGGRRQTGSTQRKSASGSRRKASDAQKD